MDSEGGDNLKKCPECRESIDKEAKRCKHCHSSLSWQRHLYLSNTTLALVLALISVITISSEKIMSLIKAPNSSLALSPVAIKNNMVSATIMNYGDRPGWVSSAEVSLSIELEGYGETALDLQLNPADFDFPLLVSEDTGEVFFTRYSDGIVLPIPENLPVDKGGSTSFEALDSNDDNVISRVAASRDNILHSLFYTSAADPENIKRCELNVAIDNFNGYREILSERIITNEYYDFLIIEQASKEMGQLAGKLACSEYLVMVYEKEFPEIAESVRAELVEQGY